MKERKVRQMKVRLRDLIEKYKRQIIIAGIILAAILVLVLLYIFVIGPWIEFKGNEKKFTNAIQEYYDRNPGYLPKNDGDYRTMTLQDAYDNGMLSETLFIPNTKRICSFDNSWVRVFKEGDDYKYYTYLECGFYKSSTDHEGPEITLEGESPVLVYFNGTYEDPGVKSVIDNKDGEMDVASVTIDTSKVNTQAIGTYKVTYVAYDKMRNRSEVTRDVTVVSNLTDLVKANTDDTNTYKGFDVNNYLQFSGMLWRIVGINDDGTIKIVLEDSVANLIYGASSYDESNVKRWLNNVFYNAIHNKDYVKQDSTFCIDTVTDVNNPTCNELSVPAPVGMLSATDYKNSLDANGESYLLNMVGFWFTNHTGTDTNVWASFRGNPMDYEQDNLGAVRPVVNLNTDELYVQSGIGSYTEPYKLYDYEYGKENDALNTRLIGEYVMYSNNSWRITSIDQDGNIELTSAGIIRDSENHDIYASYGETLEYPKLDPTMQYNLGYVLDQQVALQISSQYLIRHDWTIKELSDAYYDEVETTTITSYVSIPNSSDLFSGTNSDPLFKITQYWLADYITMYSGVVPVVNAVNGYGFVVSFDEYRSNGVKAKIYLSKDAVISSGNGTVNSPYYLK